MKGWYIIDGERGYANKGRAEIKITKHKSAITPPGRLHS
jgi:hypothetical protein